MDMKNTDYTYINKQMIINNIAIEMYCETDEWWLNDWRRKQLFEY